MAEQKNTNPTTELEMANNRPTPHARGATADLCPPGAFELDHGSILIAAVTSCTNTSNPSLMLAAALLARNAVHRGLRVPPYIKASLAPGSRVESDLLQRTGLQTDLDQLGFRLVGYGCTTCIGNSGPLPRAIEQAIEHDDLIAASVLSGNRNFEARIHQSIRANFLMSPPLVVAFALAGTIRIDLASEPVGRDPQGQPVFLRDIWPSREEVNVLIRQVSDPQRFRESYDRIEKEIPDWNDIPAPSGLLYQWQPDSTYIQEPPFFESFGGNAGPIQLIENARALAILGDSVTTDHISPAGNIKKESPAGAYLTSKGVPVGEVNSYGARRGNDRVMTRGTFANVRLRNLMTPGVEGGYTPNLLSPQAEVVPIYDAAMLYRREGIPLIVLAGKQYGIGSSRDWAAKGTRLLGVKAVIAESFERIHRRNLVGVGVLPCTFAAGTSLATLKLNGSELYSIDGLNDSIQPLQELDLVIRRDDGRRESVAIQVRIETPVEVEYFQHGGILPYVLRQVLSEPAVGAARAAA